MAARCPICTQELEDTNAVRRHTLVAHGVAAGSASGAWSTLPGPSGQPGWHPDPWNSSSLRYWDGDQWSGKTAPIGSAPEEAIVEHKRRWGRGAPAMAAAVPVAAPVAPAGAAPAWAPAPTGPPVWGAPASPDTNGWTAPAQAPAADPAPAPAPQAPSGEWGAPTAPDPAAWTSAPHPAPPWQPPAADPVPDRNGWNPPAAGPTAWTSAPPSTPPWQPPQAPEPNGWSPPTADWAPAAAVPEPDQAYGQATPDPAGWAPAADAEPGRWDSPPTDGLPAWNAPPPEGQAWNAPPPESQAWNAPPPESQAAWAAGSAAPGWVAPMAPAPPSGQSKRTLAMVVGGAIAVVVVLVAVVALGSSSGHSAKHVTAPATSTKTAPPTTAAPVAKVALSEGALSADDLGGAWTAKAAIAALGQAEVTQGPCGSPLWAHDVAGYRSSFQDGAGGFIHTGTVTSAVREAPSESVANSQAAFVTSSSYAPCLRDEMSLEIQLALKGTGLQLDAMAVDPLPLDVALSEKQSYVVSVAISDASGNQDVVSVDHVELFTSRYQATLDVTTDASLGIDRNALIQSQTERLVERLAALPTQGTIVSRGV